MPFATVGEEPTGPLVVCFHSVWFVVGAIEVEKPRCAGSWRNIGHESCVDSPALTFITGTRSVSRHKTLPSAIVLVKTLFILFFPACNRGALMF